MMRTATFIILYVVSLMVSIAFIQTNEQRRSVVANVTIYQRFYDENTLACTGRECVLITRVLLPNGQVGVSQVNPWDAYEVIVGLSEPFSHEH